MISQMYKHHSKSFLVYFASTVVTPLGAPRLQSIRRGLTKVASSEVPCGAETSSAFCVARATQSGGSTSCDRCAMVMVEEADHGVQR